MSRKGGGPSSNWPEKVTSDELHTKLPSYVDAVCLHADSRVCGISRNVCIDVGLERNRNVMRRLLKKKNLYECIDDSEIKSEKTPVSALRRIFINFFSLPFESIYSRAWATRADVDGISTPSRIRYVCRGG